MSFADIIILGLIAAAFIAVCVRIRRKGACADCIEAGECAGGCHSSRKGGCPALKGVDAVAEELGRNVR